MNSLISREVVKLPFAPSILAFGYATSNISLAVAGAGWRNVYSRILQLFLFLSIFRQSRSEGGFGTFPCSRCGTANQLETALEVVKMTSQILRPCCRPVQTPVTSSHPTLRRTPPRRGAPKTFLPALSRLIHPFQGMRRD